MKVKVVEQSTQNPKSHLSALNRFKFWNIMGWIFFILLVIAFFIFLWSMHDQPYYPNPMP